MNVDGESLIELFRPESWLGERDYEIHLSGREPCEHGFVPTDPDTPGCTCWDGKP